ncbi:MAG: FHA domain-containing protein [Archangium sp.]|nr:FHA domain-containing protein [Archangium sp.]
MTLSVRELKELTARLDEAALEKQLGAFVLVQRPLPAGVRTETLSTRPIADPSKPAKPKGVFDFEDLWVATLPPLSSLDSFVIGRSVDCDVIIDEPTVSKRHAKLHWVGGNATIEDLGAANGVFVNSVRVKGHLPVKDNDLLALGTTHMFFMLVGTLRRRMGINRSG